MRRALAERAPHLNIPHAGTDDEDAIEDLFASHGEVIAKPVSGTASTDVRLLRSITEARSLAPSGRYIFEAFVSGAEFSVESFSSDGDHEILAIAEKGTGDNFVEVSHLVPPAVLDSGQMARIGRAVRELLDALGIRNGPAHTELKLHGDAVQIIETHNRPGGDGIADLVSITAGIDWRRLCLGWPLGLRPVREITQDAAAANIFFTAKPGRVTKVADPPLWFADVKLVYWEVDVKPGDRVGELRSSRDRLGMATISGPSAKACQRVIETLGHDSVVITEDADS
jgi:biotin carboxylase